MAEAGMQQAVRDAQRGLRRAIEAFQPVVIAREEGRVRTNSDGVIRIAGLRTAAMDEILMVEGHTRALVLGLDDQDIHAVLLGDSAGVLDGARVHSAGMGADIPVGDSLLGRVVDPLGQPADGQPLRGVRTPMPLHRTAPQIHERGAIRRPLHTGILAIDAMFPIGRGQRELLLGDEGTGKTSLALDMMLRQRDTGVISVYVAIGRRRSEVWRIAQTLARRGGSFIVVAAPEDCPPGLRYLAPYAGCAMAEYFMERGHDALIIYDDLSAHAVAWREVSLLMRRPPGREAYPGDIFYQHARLLERATQLSPERGGGSLTAIPIARLESGRLSAYIPTNLISITDGQVVLSQGLFAAGQKPAIDAGLSVSRVGAKAQPQAIASLAKRLRLDFAAFLELETFSRLGTRLEASTQQRLEVGRRVRRLLRAPRLAPLDIFSEVSRLALGSAPELLVRISEEEVEQRAVELTDRLRAQLPDLAISVERDAVLTDVDRERLKRALDRLLSPEQTHD